MSTIPTSLEAPFSVELATDFNTWSTSVKTINQSVDWTHYNAPCHYEFFLNKTGCFLARANGKAVGYMVCNFSKKNLFFIAVNKEDQHKGIGLCLMGKAIEKTKEIGNKTLALDYRGANEQIGAFYKKVGELYHLDLSTSPAGFYRNGDPRIHAVYSIPDPA